MRIVGVYLLMMAVSRAISRMINDSRPGINAKPFSSRWRG